MLSRFRPGSSRPGLFGAAAQCCSTVLQHRPVLPSGGLFAVRTPGVGGPPRGGSPSGRPPARGAPGPGGSIRRGPQRYAARSAASRGAAALFGGPRRLAGVAAGAAGGLRGSPPSAVAPPGRPARRLFGPLRWSSGAGSAPPLRPRWPGGVLRASRGGGSPPRGPGLVVAGGLVPARPPRPASGGGSRPAAGRSFTAGLCSYPPRAGGGDAAAPVAPVSAWSGGPPWRRGPSRSHSHGSGPAGPSQCLRTSA